MNWAGSTVDLHDFYHEFSPCPCNLLQAQNVGSFFLSSIVASRECYATSKAVDIDGYGLARRVRRRRDVTLLHRARAVVS